MKIFFVQFSVYSCHLFLISSASVRSIPFLSFYCAHLCMKSSLGNSNFLEEISSLSHSIVFLYFCHSKSSSNYCENYKYNSLLNNYQQENAGSHQKKIPHVQGQRRSPSKMVGGVKLHLESNPIPSRDARRAQTITLCTPAETEPDLPLSV